MNVDHVLETLNRNGVKYILIGGMNFLFRHKPVLTYDIDVWIEDEKANRDRCEKALAMLDASWGKTDDEWAPVSTKSAGWLERQSVFCLISPHGSIDIFRTVKGLDSWMDSFLTGLDARTSSGVLFRSLSDEDMLKCQLALEQSEQKHDRVIALKEAIGQSHGRPEKI
ncbi:MAG TPA: hypothetical protein DCZ95_09485 [Verrucomicrobia bacterium]|nr:hypothetical protein [Verrucomicrobiota bacterium]